MNAGRCARASYTKPRHAAAWGYSNRKIVQFARTKLTCGKPFAQREKGEYGPLKQENMTCVEEETHLGQVVPTPKGKKGGYQYMYTYGQGIDCEKSRRSFCNWAIDL